MWARPGSPSGVRAVAAPTIAAGAAPEVIGRRHDEQTRARVEVAVIAGCFSVVVGRHRGFGPMPITGGVGHPLSIAMLKYEEPLPGPP